MLWIPPIRAVPAALAALALSLPACMPKLPEAPPPRNTNVEAWAVETADLEEEVVLPGLVEAVTSVRVSAEVAAVVKRRHADENDAVKAGQVLLEFDTSDLALMQLAAEAQVASLEQRVKEVKKGARDQQVREAELGVEFARSALELAQKVASRREEMFKEKLIPQEGVDQARFQVTQAQSGLDRAQEMLGLVREGALEETKKALEAQLDSAKAQAALAASQVAKATVRSPLSGIVQRRFLEENEFAGPGAPLFEIVAKTPLKVVLGVPERIFARLSEGQEVELRFPVYALDVKAKISRLGFAADARTQTFSVEIRLDNPVRVPGPDPSASREVLLRPGLIADVRLRLGVHRGAVAVPSDAVTLQGTLFTVFVVEKGKAKALPVEIGMKKEGVFEILSGLPSGSVLVIDGQKLLRDGDPVTVVKERKGPVFGLRGGGGGGEGDGGTGNGK